MARDNRDTGKTDNYSNSNMGRIGSLMKTYQGRTKFTGFFEHDFEGALETFETSATVCQLNEEEKARAFPFMLDQGALSHFTNNFGGRTYTYSEVISTFKSWYTSEELRSRLLLQWKKPPLTDAMRQSPDKSEVEVFRALVEKLTSIRRHLHPSYREDRFLRD